MIDSSPDMENYKAQKKKKGVFWALHVVGVVFILKTRILNPCLHSF